MPSSSLGTLISSAPAILSVCSTPRNVGASTSTLSPRSKNMRQIRSIPCMEPVVGKMQLSSASTPLGFSICSLIALRSGA